MPAETVQTEEWALPDCRKSKFGCAYNYLFWALCQTIMEWETFYNWKKYQVCSWNCSWLTQEAMLVHQFTMSPCAPHWFTGVYCETGSRLSAETDDESFKTWKLPDTKTIENWDST